MPFVLIINDTNFLVAAVGVSLNRVAEEYSLLVLWLGSDWREYGATRGNGCEIPSKVVSLLNGLMVRLAPHFYSIIHSAVLVDNSLQTTYQVYDTPSTQDPIDEESDPENVESLDVAMSGSLF